MALEIFKNDDEDILFGQDGNVFRTPYDFGKAFQNRMGLSNYFFRDDIPFPTNYTVVAIIKAAAQNSWFLSAKASSLNKSDNFASYNQGKSCNIIDSLSTGLNTSTHTLTEYGLSAFISLPNELKVYNPQTKTLSVAIQSRVEAQRNSITLARGSFSNDNSDASLSYMPATAMLNDVKVFNRELSLAELIYIESNQQYNDPQSTLGLVHHWLFNKCEIINIGGTDFAGVKDIVGGYDVQGLNLPAGTPQQKVDYANANLFVPFIS